MTFFGASRASKKIQMSCQMMAFRLAAAAAAGNSNKRIRERHSKHRNLKSLKTVFGGCVTSRTDWKRGNGGGGVSFLLFLFLAIKKPTKPLVLLPGRTDGREDGGPLFLIRIYDQTMIGPPVQFIHHVRGLKLSPFKTVICFICTRGGWVGSVLLWISTGTMGKV